MPMTWTKVKPPWNCSRFGTSPRRFVTSSPRFGTSPQPCRKGVKMIGGENAQGQSPKEFSTFCCSELGPRVSLVWIQVTSLILTCCLVEMEYGWKFRESQGSQNPFSSTFLVFVFLKMHKAKLYYHMVLPICSRWIQTPIFMIVSHDDRRKPAVLLEYDLGSYKMFLSDMLPILLAKSLECLHSWA